MNNLFNHLPLLVILLPLSATLLCPLLSKWHEALGKRVVIWAMFFTIICAVLQLVQIIKTGEAIHYWMGGYKPPYGIEFVVDGVNGLIVLLVSVVSYLTALYSSPFEATLGESWFRTSGYYTMLAFLSVGLLGMASTGDAFNLYVFMEITALSGYGLIAVGEEKGPIAAFRYLLLGTVGASMYLLGIGFLYAATGTLNMADLAVKVAALGDSPLLVLSVACLIVGFGIKMALFPIHGWQPAAHSYAHPAADPMIAGIMIKIPAYGMLRFFYCIFRETSPMMEYFFQIIGIMGVCGILFGSLKALRYTTLNKILAYSSIGQVGYIALGFSLGNFYGIVGAILHIISHAFMKTGLFYVSGSLKYKYGIHEITQLGQVYRKMPTTALALVVCALSMIGLPPFAGFFSKWYLALGAIEEGKYIYVAVLIISSLLSAIYFFRILEKLFMDQPADLCETHGIAHEKESERREELGGTVEADELNTRPWQIVVPLLVVVFAILGIGLGQAYIVSDVLETTVMEVFLT